MKYIHPTLTVRFQRIRRLHRSIGEPGELTTREEIRVLDPEGVLSLALEIGEQEARRVLEMTIRGEGR